MKILLKLLIFLVCLGIVAALFLRQLRISADREARALAVQQDAAQAACEKIDAAEQSVSGMVTRAAVHAVNATNALHFVTGSTDLGFMILQPRPVKVVKRKARVRESRPAPAPVAVAAKDDTPDGIMSLRDLELKKAIDKMEASRPPREQEEPDEPAEDETEPDTVPEILEQPAKQPEIRELARSVVSGANSLENSLAIVRSIQPKARKTRADVLGSSHAVTAAAKRRLLPELEDSALQIEKEAAELLEEMEKTADEIKSIRKRVDKERKERAKEEERLRKIEERKALLKEEAARIKLFRGENLKLAQEHKYREAVAAARLQLAGFKTEQAQSAMSAMRDRYSHLQDLKAYIIKRLNSKPFEWGWGFGASAVDVVGANAVELRLADKTVPWSEVSAKQMLKFVDHYLANQKLRMSVLGRQNFNAALYSYELGLDDKIGPYLKTALEHQPELAGEARRLMPKE